MTRVQVVPSTGPPSKAVCFRCRNKGHYKVDCPLMKAKQPDKRPKIAATWAEVVSRPNPAELPVHARSLGYAALQKRVQQLESQICALREQLTVSQQIRPAVNSVVVNEVVGAAAALAPPSSVVSRSSPGAEPVAQNDGASKRKKRQERRSRRKPLQPVQVPAALNTKTTAVPVVAAQQQQQEQPCAGDEEEPPELVAWRKRHVELRKMLDAPGGRPFYEWVKTNREEALTFKRGCFGLGWKWSCDCGLDGYWIRTKISFATDTLGR